MNVSLIIILVVLLVSFFNNIDKIHLKKDDWPCTAEYKFPDRVECVRHERKDWLEESGDYKNGG